MNCKKCPHIRLDVKTNNGNSDQPFRHYCSKNGFTSIESTSNLGASGLFNGYVYYTDDQLTHLGKRKYCDNRYWLGIKDIITFTISTLALTISLLAYFKGETNKPTAQVQKNNKSVLSRIDTTGVKKEQGITNAKFNCRFSSDN